MANQELKIRTACENAFEAFKKIADSKNDELQAKLEFVIGSYDFDKNPIGLYEIGKLALTKLTKIKEKNTKLVTKKLLTDLEKALKA